MRIIGAKIWTRGLEIPDIDIVALARGHGVLVPLSVVIPEVFAEPALRTDWPSRTGLRDQPPHAQLEARMSEQRWLKWLEPACLS